MRSLVGENEARTARAVETIDVEPANVAFPQRAVGVFRWHFRVGKAKGAAVYGNHGREPAI
jgi:hypothetical protein